MFSIQEWYYFFFLSLFFSLTYNDDETRAHVATLLTAIECGARVTAEVKAAVHEAGFTDCEQ